MRAYANLPNPEIGAPGRRIQIEIFVIITHSPRAVTTDNNKHRRAIRSFVRRAGRITPSQQRAFDTLWPVFGVEYDAGVLDIERLYGRLAPLVVEIGFGNGETLVEQAVSHPDWDFLGIEVHEPGIGHCLLKAEQAGVSNLRIVNHDAIDVLTHQLAPGSLARLNLYFPDPWPKKRHHKRRIVAPRFLDLVADRLAAGGTMHIATDWANYAEHIDEVLSRSDRFACVERREHDGDRPLDRPQTKFERRGLRKGHRICDWCFEKTANND